MCNLKLFTKQQGKKWTLCLRGNWLLSRTKKAATLHEKAITVNFNQDELLLSPLEAYTFKKKEDKILDKNPMGKYYL